MAAKTGVSESNSFLFLDVLAWVICVKYYKERRKEWVDQLNIAKMYACLRYTLQFASLVTCFHLLFVCSVSLHRHVSWKRQRCDQFFFFNHILSFYFSWTHAVVLCWLHQTNSPPNIDLFVSVKDRYFNHIMDLLKNIWSVLDVRTDFLSVKHDSLLPLVAVLWQYN